MDKKSKLENNYVVWMIAFLCCLLWGSAFPFIKIGYNVLSISSQDTPTIILFAGIRFFVAGLLTIIIFSILSKKFLIPKQKSLKQIGILSLFQTILQYLFFYLGLAYTTGVNASIVNGSSVFISLLISSLLFHQEKLKAQKILGCLLGFFGVCIAGLVGTKFHVGLNLGDIFILLSAISYSFSSAFMKSFSKHENPALLSGYQFVFGGLVMMVVGYIFGGKISLNSKGIGIIVYLAFISAIAYSLWSILLKHNDVSKIAVCGSMTPIAGFVLSYFLLNEQNGSLLFNIIGLALVVIGIIVVNIKKRGT